MHKLWFHDLNKWVLMDDSLLTDLAIVKVLANGALVSDTYNRTNTASIASYILMIYELEILTQS